MTLPHESGRELAGFDLLSALEQLLKTEPAVPIRRAAQRLYIELTEPERKAA